MFSPDNRTSNDSYASGAAAAALAAILPVVLRGNEMV